MQSGSTVIQIVVRFENVLTDSEGESIIYLGNGACIKPPELPAESKLEVFSQRQWEHKTVCPPELANKDFTSYHGLFYVNNVTAYITDVNAQGEAVFIIRNDAPRAFETLKLRVIKTTEATPTEIEVPGPIHDFTAYILYELVSGVSKAEDVSSVSVILPTVWYDFGVHKYTGTCNDTAKHTEVTWEQERNYARLIGDIQYMVNSPEYRRQFFFEMSKGAGWSQRQYHFDHVVTNNKQKMEMGTINCCNTGAAGFGGGNWLSVYKPAHDWYQQDYNSGIGFITYHEFTHAWGYAHSDFVLNMQIAQDKIIKEMNRDCHIQHLIPPLERYSDHVGLSAFYNPTDSLIYVFSAHGFRTFDLKGTVCCVGFFQTKLLAGRVCESLLNCHFVLFWQSPNRRCSLGSADSDAAPVP